jgi:molybdate transport system ATP-binding protein
MTVLEVAIQGIIGTLSIEAQLDTRGGTLVLVGPNGAGKTTLLLMILGIRRLRSGRISVGETTLLDTAAKVELSVEERRLGYVPQDYALFPHLTVIENVEFALACGNSVSNRKARRHQAEGLLADLGLAQLARRRPSELSGGEKQKVALARALAVQPRALLLDEPLAALDAAARREVRAFLAEYLRKLKLPAIVVTHDPADAAALGDRIAVIEAGRIVQAGTWSEIRERPASPFVEQFVTS